jgi:dihydropteroate synthase
LIFDPQGCSFEIGGTTFDLTRQVLIMGVLNRTPDSFFDAGAYYDLDRGLRRADELVAQGSDILDIGGVKAGPGPEVSVQEELERVVPAIEILRRRFDIPISIDTWRAEVAEAAFRAGAQVGNDISGFADPRYLTVAASAGAAVVATHIRLAPRVRDPDPHYRDLVGDVASFLQERAARARAAGISPRSIVVDAGLDLGKTATQSQELLLSSHRLADLGYPLLLSASNKRFIGDLCHLEVQDRRLASAAATAIGLFGGCRIVRTHDPIGVRKVSNIALALLEHRYGQ